MAKVYRRKNSPFLWLDYWHPRLGRVRESSKTKDKALAQRVLGDKLREVEELRDGKVAGKMAWSEFRSKYKDARATKALSTLQFDRLALADLETVLKPAWLSDLTLDSLAKMAAWWKKHTPSKASARRRFQAAKVAMRYAEARGWRKPPERWDMIDAPFPEPPSRQRFYSVEEMDAIFTALASDPWASTVAHLGYYTTLRRQEMLYLEWRDIDLKHGRLWLNPKPDVPWYPKGWKDGQDTPWVAIPGPLAAYLATLPRKSARWVLSERQGPQAMSARFSRALKRAGLSGFLHLLRHTSLSHLGTQGLSARWLQEQARHADPRMTTKYTKLGDAAKYKTAEAFPARPGGLTRTFRDTRRKRR